jgi:hypothetical protein
MGMNELQYVGVQEDNYYCGGKAVATMTTY